MDKITAYRDIAFNPVVELLVGFCAVEWLQSQKRSDGVTPLMPDVAGNFLEGAIAISVLFQQLSPLVPYVTNIAETATDAAKSAAPLLTTVAGAATLIPGVPPPP